MAIINNLCAPALIYLFYSFSQIFIDLYKKMYNTAFLKFIIMIIFTFLLNMLCAQGLGIVSWIIVFIPFMLMSLITAILLYVFGLDPYSGKISSLRVKNPSATVTDSVSISQPHSTQPKNITIKASGANSRPGTNDVIGNTFDSMNSKFDKIV